MNTLPSPFKPRHRLYRTGGYACCLLLFINGLHAEDATQRPLNDTGIIYCANHHKNNLDCQSSSFYPQDATQGRDAISNSNENGHGGFSFSKLDGEGNLLANDATNWACVKDNVTGLVWEVKTDDAGLHDKDWLYSWYQTDTSKNGGGKGVKNGATTACYGKSNCNTEDFVAAVNAQSLCGFDDWRVPTRQELNDLVNFDAFKPTIDTDYFVNTLSASYWTATPNVDNSGGAWLVSFVEGNDAWAAKGSTFPVRLVRGGAQ